MIDRVPIRWRLTLWYLLLLSIALAVFSSLFYFGLRHLLYGSLDTTLRHQASLVRQAVMVDGDELRLSVAQVIDPANDDQFVRLRDAQGRVVAETGTNLQYLSNNADTLPAGWPERPALRWIRTGDDRLRVLSEPITRDGVVVGALDVGMESDVDDTLGFALKLIGGSAPLILVFAVGGGFWLAGRALGPIDRIARTAAGIGEHDLSRRITLSLPDDEVGRLARTFNAMLDRIEEAFGRQRRFTADAAHELRTPLALMQSQIELALAQPRDPVEDRAVLQLLATDVDRLARLSSALLALARSEARGLQLVHEPIELASLLELVVEQYGPLAEAANVTIVIDAQPVSLAADHELLLQVIANLLDNALRHAPERSEVTLGCRLDDDKACLWIADQGTGISPEHLPHLFEPFYRIEPDRDRRRGGIGLGLSICKLIVDAHSGTIEIASALGAGTTVTVCLPRWPATAGNRPTPEDVTPRLRTDKVRDQSGASSPCHSERSDLTRPRSRGI